MKTEDTFEEGWLGRQLDAATHRIRASHSAGSPWVKHMSDSPLNDHDAFQLFKILDERFESWTGKTLAEYLAFNTAMRGDSNGLQCPSSRGQGLAPVPVLWRRGKV